jgi:hypothetical protein
VNDPAFTAFDSVEDNAPLLQSDDKSNVSSIDNTFQSSEDGEQMCYGLRKDILLEDENIKRQVFIAAAGILLAVSSILNCSSAISLTEGGHSFLMGFIIVSLPFISFLSSDSSEINLPNAFILISGLFGLYLGSGCFAGKCFHAGSLGHGFGGSSTIFKFTHIYIYIFECFAQ